MAGQLVIPQGVGQTSRRPPAAPRRAAPVSHVSLPPVSVQFISRRHAGLAPADH